MIARVLLLAFAASLALPAAAQALYKLVDRHGRVTYSDSEPGNFDGKVIVLEPDTATNVLPSAKAREGSPRPDVASGLGEERRRNRELLEGRLHEARARADAARQAKAQGDEILPDELQTIQHLHPPLRRGQQPPNPNCFAAADAHGSAFLNCPTRVPHGAYFERQKQLEEELTNAEAELELAERAYRRGTD